MISQYLGDLSHDSECVMVGRVSHADCLDGILRQLANCHRGSTSVLINALLDAHAPFQLVDQPIMCIIGSHTELLRSSFTLRSWWEAALYQT